MNGIIVGLTVRSIFLTKYYKFDFCVLLSPILLQKVNSHSIMNKIETR